MHSKTLSNLSLLAGRAMLAAMFISAGFSKIGAYAGTQAYMESVGVPGLLLPAVIALEIVGGFAVLAGIQTSITALLLAGFTLVATIIFHSDFSQQIQTIMFSKNIAITGAFLLLYAHGPGDWSIKFGSRVRRATA
ncbi:MAG: DoxX family protein [Gammaproteobacteria bacterium]|jgi:putative oxidoreductase|nr:DoxX family protein [Gammaproteobacteria bacterium]